MPRHGSHGWGILQERYITALLFEYAATLGLVDVAYTAPEDARGDFRFMWGTDELGFLSRYDGLSCLRLNALGAFILGAADRYDPATPSPNGSVIVFPNLDVAAAGDRFSPATRRFSRPSARVGAKASLLTGPPLWPRSGMGTTRAN